MHSQHAGLCWWLAELSELHNYVRRCNICRVTTDAPCHLAADAFGKHRPEVAGLAAPLHRGLALALALAAAGLRDAEAAQRYVGHMLRAIARELSGLAGAPNSHTCGYDGSKKAHWCELHTVIGCGPAWTMVQQAHSDTWTVALQQWCTFTLLISYFGTWGHEGQAVAVCAPLQSGPT